MHYLAEQTLPPAMRFQREIAVIAVRCQLDEQLAPRNRAVPESSGVKRGAEVGKTSPALIRVTFGHGLHNVLHVDVSHAAAQYTVRILIWIHRGAVKVGRVKVELE